MRLGCKDGELQLEALSHKIIYLIHNYVVSCLCCILVSNNANVFAAGSLPCLAQVLGIRSSMEVLSFQPCFIHRNLISTRAKSFAFSLYLDSHKRDMLLLPIFCPTCFSEELLYRPCFVLPCRTRYIYIVYIYITVAFPGALAIV